MESKLVIFSLDGVGSFKYLGLIAESASDWNRAFDSVSEWNCIGLVVFGAEWQLQTKKETS